MRFYVYVVTFFQSKSVGDVSYTQNYLVLGLCPSFRMLKTRKCNVSEIFLRDSVR
jgi:hypothetical protein